MIDEMPDDNTLRVVLMRGKQIVSSQEYDPAVCIPVELKYEKRTERRVCSAGKADAPIAR